MNVSRAELIISCARPGQFPDTGLPEIAFLGRSNVGKSSLLNALAHRKALARTSSTPGKTRLIHFFAITRGKRDVVLVDLPGYGFAKVPERERRSWQRLVEAYLEDRPALKAAVLLQDVRRDFSEDETLLLEWLAERGVDAIIAFTKCDKLKPMRRKQRIQQLKQQVAKPSGGFVTTSSDKKIGIDDLWRAAYRLIAGGADEPARQAASAPGDPADLG